MNRWKGVLEFIAVVEAGSFSKAADNLDVSVSQVSKRIQDIERRLNVSLLNRSTRRLAPSEEGKIFYAACKRMMEELDHVEESIGTRHDSTSGKVKLCCVGVAQPKFLINIFSSFLDCYPKINLEILFADKLPNLLEEGVDFALSVGNSFEGAYNTVRLAWLDYKLAASPAFIERHGVPGKPKHLESIPCVINDASVWRLSSGDKTVSVNIAGQWTSSNVAACVDACLAGMGVFMLPPYSLDHYARQKRLVNVLPDWYVRKPLMAVAPRGQRITAKVSLMVSFLQDAMGIDPPAANMALNELIDAHRGSRKIIKEIGDALKKEGIGSPDGTPTP